MTDERRQRTRLQEYSLTYPPEIIIYDTSYEVDQFATSSVIDQVGNKQNSVLTLPTGITPMAMYDLLCQAFDRGDIDFSRVTASNLDEYWPIRREHPASYHRYMMERLITRVNFQSGNWHIPDGEAPDSHVEAERYDNLLNQLPPSDLAILGIGPVLTCHIAFNEQGSEIDSRVRYVELDKETKRANAPHFPDPSEIPQGAITQGIANILRAKSILLIAKGEGKAQGIQRTIMGPIGPEAPASFLRLHPHVIFVLDKAAAQLLK